MHALTILIIHATSTSTTVAGKSSKKSSSFLPLLIIVGLFVLVYFLFLRPRSQRLRQQQTAARQLGVGDQVMSAGGIFGTVVAIDANQVEVEVAPGTVLTFIRRAVSLREGATPTSQQPVDDEWEVPHDDHDDHADDYHDHNGDEPDGSGESRAS